jgi:hypothetical protein
MPRSKDADKNSHGEVISLQFDYRIPCGQPESRDGNVNRAEFQVFGPIV